MVFREDHSRVRCGHAAHNFSLLRHDYTARCGIKGRRLKAALSTAYLLSVLNGSFSMRLPWDALQPR
jgi:hypothetical protein